MRKKALRSTGARFAILAVLALFALALAAVAASAQRWSAQQGGSMTPAVGVSAKFAVVKPSNTTPGGSVHFTCQLTSPPGCYGPDQIRAAYGVQGLLNKGINGSGRTIVIIDAFGSATLAADLQTFDALWGLPNPTLNVIAPNGVGATDSGNLFGWGVETSLDVEWAHVIAPAATIDLVIAKTNDDADILSATKYAIDHNLGDVISQSFGEAEACMNPTLLAQQHSLFSKATQKGTTLFASSGDNGAAQPTCDGSSLFKSAGTPASDPLVTSVGGTSLLANGISGAYGSETTWNDAFGASGGGFSTIYGRPNYQTGVVNGSQRGVPDVAYNAAVIPGVIVRAFCPAFVCGTDGSVYFRVGGTSAGSPQWAGLAALADQIANDRLATINPTLYMLAKKNLSLYFHDITTGNNDFAGITGFAATTGWDAATGWGSPLAGNVVPALANNATNGGGNNGGGNNGGGNNGGGNNGGGHRH